MGADRHTYSQVSLNPIHHHSQETVANMKTLLLAVIPMVIFAMVDAQYGRGGCDWRECRNNRSLAQRCCDLSGTCCDFATNPGNNNGGQGYNPGWNNGYNNGGGNGNGNCYNGNCYNPGYGNNGGNYNGGGYNINNKPGNCPPYNGRKKRSPRGRFPGNNNSNNGGSCIRDSDCFADFKCCYLQSGLLPGYQCTRPNYYG